MLMRLLSSALAAGLVAGILITLLQAFTTTPLIIQAEQYEALAPASIANHEHEHQNGDAASAITNSDHHHHGGDGESPHGLNRLIYTSLANIIAGVGFSLLIAVGLSFQKKEFSPLIGLAYGMCGFVIFTLAPALGLPPRLPGMAETNLVLSQIWWISAVAAASICLYSLFYLKPFPLKILGIIIFFLPLIWGAPIANESTSLVPAMLASQFTATSIAVNCIFWAIMGFSTNYFYQKFHSAS